MKSAFLSKTIWFNVLGAFALILSSPEVTGLLSPEQVKYAIGAQAIINVLLRFKTTEPVTIRSTGDG